MATVKPVRVRIDHDCQPDEVARRFLAALAELGVQAEDVTPTEDDLEPPMTVDWLEYEIYPPHCGSCDGSAPECR